MMSYTGICCFLAIIVTVKSAPAFYDQRQDGKLNVHADLENFLIVVATNGKNNDLSLMSSLALQQLMEARQKAQQGPSEKFEYKLEEHSSDEGKEPYSVEILKIRKEDGKRSSDSKIESDLDQKPVLIQEHSKPTVAFEVEVNEDSLHNHVKVIPRNPTNQSGPQPKLPVVNDEKKGRSEEYDNDYLPMKLLGDGIEDCGPGRTRNRYGICEADEEEI